MYFDVVGGLRVYDIAIFIVSTPVVWIAGFRIYKGAYLSLRNRNVNMDVLVTVGVLAGWIYGVLNVFFLPNARGRFRLSGSSHRHLSLRPPGQIH